MIVLLALLLLPISVSAGLVGVLGNFFWKGAEAKDVGIIKNVQNMSLLAALPSSASTDYFESVITGDALVANAGPSGTAADIVVHKLESDQISIYVVREGDTLSQIAEMFNVTVNTIKWGNDLSSNTLKEGQTLVILPISGVKHTVVKGDTLQSIAKKYKGDAEEIVAYNDLDDSRELALGTIIIIPDGEAVTVRTSTSSTGSGSTKTYEGYYIRPVAGGRKTQGIHGHNGIDIGAPLGTEILAAADGEVIISRNSGWNGGYGSYVVIRHSNGTQTLYAHNSSNIVSVGDSITQGQVIGYMGRSGKATGVHLHFEIRGAKNPF